MKFVFVWIINLECFLCVWCFLSFLYELSYLMLTTSSEAGGVIILTLRIWKLRHGEVE